MILEAFDKLLVLVADAVLYISCKHAALIPLECTTILYRL